MALIKVDPNQKGATIALIGILLSVVGVTIMRVAPSDGAVQPVAKAEAATPSTASARVTADTEYASTRNPFQKPHVGASAAGSSQDRGLVPEGGLTGHNAWRIGSPPRVSLPDNTPLPVQPAIQTQGPTADKAPAQPQTAAVEPRPTPQFTLVATIKGDESYSAVIRTGDSGDRVVDVGDVVADGFKVKRIDAACAVLTDGRSVIVATRPQS